MYTEKADELINFILNITVPEIDIDQYKIIMNISAEEYALKKANELCRASFFSNSQSGSIPSNPGDKVSSEELSDDLSKQ